MNEYQQALMRIIELEDKNAELLEAMERILRSSNSAKHGNSKAREGAIYTINRIATEAIRKGE